MTITSFYYFAFILLGACIYYIVPKKIQWLELLVLSIVFYCLVANPITIAFPVLATVLAYFSTNIQKADKIRGKNKNLGCAIVTIAIIICLGLWFWLKASDIWISLSYRLSRIMPWKVVLQKPNAIAALGMGYYTLQVVGYILDCYWGTINPQKNIFKLLLFVIFFPQMMTGPISRYSQIKSIYEPQEFCYDNIAFGTQRILWGVFKKIIIADRVGIIVNGIYGSLDTYTGWWYWIALLIYPLQMYADFSGCTDIVLGTGEVFGIRLPENFCNPFFSKTSQEFWQRWHITLGAWAKDYVLYPILKTKWLLKLGKTVKRRFGKFFGKFIPTSIGMFFLWMVMGIWHGSMKYIIGVSLWYWIMLMLGEIFSPLFTKLITVLKVNTECFSWHLFQAIRTYLIYAVGAVFFRADGFGEAIKILRGLLKIFTRDGYNIWIWFDSSILDLGVSYNDLNIVIISIAVLVVVAVLRERHGYARNWIKKQLLPFRWLIWITLFVMVLILGNYGPDYIASEFIYQGF